MQRRGEERRGEERRRKEKCIPSETRNNLPRVNVSHIRTRPWPVQNRLIMWFSRVLVESSGCECRGFICWGGIHAAKSCTCLGDGALARWSQRVRVNSSQHPESIQHQPQSYRKRCWDLHLKSLQNWSQLDFPLGYGCGPHTHTPDRDAAKRVPSGCASEKQKSNILILVAGGLFIQAIAGTY